MNVSLDAIGRRTAAVAIPTALFAIAIGVWELVVRLAHVEPYLLVPPSTVAARIASDGALLSEHLAITAQEVIGGFMLAFLAAVVIGVTLAYSTALRRAALPLLVASKTVPIIAVAPLLIIWFGYSMTPKVLITALVCFFPMTLNTVTGFMSVDRETDRLFRALGASRRDRFLKLAVPTAAPLVFTGMKISVPLSVIGATVSEWAGSSAGLGYLILTYSDQLDTSAVFASIALLSLTGIVMYGVVAGIEYLVTPWRHRARARRRRRASRSVPASQPSFVNTQPQIWRRR